MLKQEKYKIHKNNKLSPKDKLKIVLEYVKGASIQDLSNKFKITNSAIIGFLKRRSIKIRPNIYRKWRFDENYFTKLDTEFKAYFFGYLCADGWINYSKTRRYYGVSMQLAETDKNILELLVTALNGDQKMLIYRPGKIMFIGNNKKISKCQPSVMLRLNSKKMSEDLIRLGCVAKKSLILEFPNLENNMVRHFIRGYMDGDGCITYDKKKINIYVYFCGSERFFEKMNVFLNECLNIKFSISKCKDSKIWKAGLGGNKRVIGFLDWLYQDSSIFLNRKYNKFLDFLKLYKNKPIKGDTSLYPINKIKIFEKYLNNATI